MPLFNQDIIDAIQDDPVVGIEKALSIVYAKLNAGVDREERIDILQETVVFFTSGH